MNRFAGFKEESYLDRSLDLPAWPSEREPGSTYAVFRLPVGALCHRAGNERFVALLVDAAKREDLRALVLRRWEGAAGFLLVMAGLDVAGSPLEGIATLILVDIFVAGSGTMSREAAWSAPTPIRRSQVDSRRSTRRLLRSGA